jgi:hypothetical protein
MLNTYNKLLTTEEQFDNERTTDFDKLKMEEDDRPRTTPRSSAGAGRRLTNDIPFACHSDEGGILYETTDNCRPTTDIPFACHFDEGEIPSERYPHSGCRG